MNIVLILDKVWESSHLIAQTYVKNLPVEKQVIFLEDVPIVDSMQYAENFFIIDGRKLTGLKDTIDLDFYTEKHKLDAVMDGVVFLVSDLATMELLVLIELLKRAAREVSNPVPNLCFSIRREQIRFLGDFETIKAFRSGPLEESVVDDIQVMVDKVRLSKRTRWVRFLRDFAGVYRVTKR